MNSQDVGKYRRSTHRIFTLSRSDAVLEAALFVCIVGLTRCCGGVHKLLLGRDVVQTGAHSWAERREKGQDKNWWVKLHTGYMQFNWSGFSSYHNPSIWLCLNPKCYSEIQVMFLSWNLSLPNYLWCCRYVKGRLTPGSWWCNPGCTRTRWMG